VVVSLTYVDNPISCCTSITNAIINNSQPQNHYVHSPCTLINLSSFNIYSPSLHLLEKGFNFSLSPHSIHIKDTISSIESITLHLPTHETEEIRQDFGRILHHSKPSKPNLTKEEFQFICLLNNNPNIIILKVNKGNTIVIMNSFDYHSKLYDLISSSFYKPLAKNFLSTITSLVSKTIQSSSSDPNIQKNRIPHNPTTPMFYGKPKIHKKDIPLRPIISAIIAPTHAFFVFLANKPRSFVGKTSSFIKYSFYFIQKTQNIQLNDHEFIVSFDVVSLFTKIPVLEALDLISELVDPKTINLIKIYLTSTFFTFKGKFYEQTKGTFMGSYLYPMVTNVLWNIFNC
jgi:hypothetical protein